MFQLKPAVLRTCDWVLYASGVVATGTYVLTLQVSDLVGGTYVTISTFTLPPARQLGGFIFLLMQISQPSSITTQSL